MVNPALRCDVILRFINWNYKAQACSRTATQYVAYPSYSRCIYYFVVFFTKRIFKKGIDVSTIPSYYRGSSWVKKLYITNSGAKNKNHRKTPRKRPFLAGGRFIIQINVRLNTSFIAKIRPLKGGSFSFRGGAAGYCPRVQKVTRYSSTSLFVFNDLGRRRLKIRRKWQRKSRWKIS